MFRLRTSFRRQQEPAPPPSCDGGSSAFGRYRAYLLLALFVSTLLFLVWSRHSEVQARRAVELRLELQQMRTAISIYLVQSGKSPPDLQTLAASGVRLPGSGQIPLLEWASFDAEGNITDPFGYPYIYDPLAGTVYSSAPCCRNW